MSKYNSDLDELIPPKIQLIDKEFIDKTINDSTSIIVNTDNAYS
jgi:hypothetical protein